MAAENKSKAKVLTKLVEQFKIQNVKKGLSRNDFVAALLRAKNKAGNKRLMLA